MSGYHVPAEDEGPTEYKNLEANILRGMADDLTVSARPSRAELTVIKQLPAKQ